MSAVTALLARVALLEQLFLGRICCVLRNEGPRLDARGLGASGDR